jgi:hypothetical protein
LTATVLEALADVDAFAARRSLLVPAVRESIAAAAQYETT